MITTVHRLSPLSRSPPILPHPLPSLPISRIRPTPLFWSVGGCYHQCLSRYRIFGQKNDACAHKHFLVSRNRVRALLLFAFFPSLRDCPSDHSQRVHAIFSSDIKLSNCSGEIPFLMGWKRGWVSGDRVKMASLWSVQTGSILCRNFCTIASLFENESAGNYPM